ncbi:MAG: polyphosphate kinase [Gaiellaceae bacterium]|jgi:polyphosphate kinase|nr:polyphosphate kinase [Gaiellaceae bacterium]
MTATAARETSGRLLNRELSTLEYNARLLDLAGDDSLPLLERVRMCRFVSSNLDEFFMVRVAGLMGQAAAGLAVRSADGLTPRSALALIRERVLELTVRQAKLWKKTLRPALADEGIVVAQIEDLVPDELAELEERFQRAIFPVLTPLGVGPGQPFPYISGLSLSLGVLARDPESGEERFARVKVPEGLPRFFSVGDRGLLLPLEVPIAHFLERLFPGMEILERSVFRVTRDADFEVSDEADDLLEAVELELQRRRFGDVVRVEVSSSTSQAMLERLCQGLGAAPDQVYEIHGPLDLADLDQLIDLDRPELKFEPSLGVTPSRLVHAKEPRELFAEIRRGDFLVHQPYESFAASFEAFVQAAARDPDVIAMKTAVYRTSGDSPLVPALIQCAEDGKQSVCLVELKARFDEHRNIEWSRALEQAGVHVVYGFPDLKVHAKMTLVVRREGDQLRRYVHVGTGNYHAVTARSYEDLSLFTADPAIAEDIASLFNYLTGFGRPSRFQKILVAPFGLRTRLVERIRAAGQAAASGTNARIRIKVNALTDETVIEELYTASQHGAKIEIVARSICMLKPGVPGMSENICVRSIVGRYLEHSRLYAFEIGDEIEVFLGSADLMTRNLDRRIEVVVPVEQTRLRQELTAIFDSSFADTASSWELLSDGTSTRRKRGKDERAHSHQLNLQRRARLRTRRAGGARSR